MKNILFAVLALGLAFSSCKDEETPDLQIEALQNDSIDNFADATFLLQYKTNEIFGATMGPINERFQVSTVSFLFGGGPATPAQVQVRINDDNGVSNPLTQLYSGNYTITPSNTELQQIDLRDQNIILPNGKYRVSIVLLETPGSSIGRDQATQKENSNWIKANSFGTWKPATTFSMNNNFIIRSEIILNPPTE